MLLLHPGGPFWAKKDAGAWSIPEGRIEEGDTPLAAARREFVEELGRPPPEDGMVPHADFRLPGHRREEITRGQLPILATPRVHLAAK